jgi:serine/threonine-protein kinase
MSHSVRAVAHPIRLSVVALLLMLCRNARADDAAAAQALFDDARRLLADHRTAEACAKLEESQRLDPGIGTLYHFADCEERLGKTASAWAAFRAVASEARAAGQSARATAAEGRAASLEPRLARLMVDPGAEVGTPGLQVSRDGEPVGSGQWSTAIPVDPGPHLIEARAPGKGSWTTTVSSSAGATTEVAIPLLADLGVAPPVLSGDSSAPARSSSVTSTTSADVPLVPRGRGQRVAGIVVGAAGLAGLGVGGYFGVASILQRDDSQAHCTGNVCDATGVAARNAAQLDGTASTIAFGAGGALLLAGIVIYAASPRAYRDPLQQSQTDSRPTVAIGPGSVAIHVAW